MKPTEVDSMNRLRVEAVRQRNQFRGALLWILWHHQGASSIPGLAARRALGIGQFDHLTDSQIAEAKEWAAEHDAFGVPPSDALTAQEHATQIAEALADLPAQLRAHPGIKRLYRAAVSGVDVPRGGEQ